jgi:hypothetical protein
MDYRLFKFAEVYELEALGQRVPAATPRPVARPGAGALMRQVSRVGRGLRDTQQWAASGAASVGRGAVGSVRNIMLRAPRIDARITNLLKQNKVKAVRGANGEITFRGKPGWETAVGDDIIAVKAAAKHHMYGREIAGRFRNIEDRITAWEMATGRSANRFYDNYTTALASGGIRQVIANARLPRMRQAIAVSTALTVLYYLFSGNAPRAQTPEMQTVVQNTPNPGMPIIPEIIKRIDVVTTAATAAGQTQAVASLNALKTALTNVKGAQLDLDNPASGQSFTQLIRSAEATINTALPQIQTLEGSLQGEQLAAAKELQGALGEFLLEVSHVRGAIS